MKKNSFKIIVKKISATLLASAVLFLNTTSAQMPVVAALYENSAFVKYVGADNESYVFNVAYNNDNGDKFLLTIINGSGDTIFAGTYNEKKFDKRFRLLKEGNERLNFVIKNLRDRSIQTFEIRSTTQITEDVVVRKIK